MTAGILDRIQIMSGKLVTSLADVYRLTILRDIVGALAFGIRHPVRMAKRFVADIRSSRWS